MDGFKDADKHRSYDDKVGKPSPSKAPSLSTQPENLFITANPENDLPFVDSGAQSVPATEGNFYGDENDSLIANANKILDKSQILPPGDYSSLRTVITTNEDNSRSDKINRTWTGDKNKKGECDSSFSDNHNTGNQRSSSIIPNTSHQYSRSKRKTEESEGFSKAEMHDLWSINPKTEDGKEITPVEKLDKLCSDNFDGKNILPFKPQKELPRSDINIKHFKTEKKTPKIDFDHSQSEGRLCSDKTDCKDILPSKPPKELPRSDTNLKHSRTEKKIPEIVSDHSQREGCSGLKTIFKVVDEQGRVVREIPVSNCHRREKKRFTENFTSGSSLLNRPTCATRPGEVSHRIRSHSVSEGFKDLDEVQELTRDPSDVVIPKESEKKRKRDIRELNEAHEENQDRLKRVKKDASKKERTLVRRKSEPNNMNSRFRSRGIKVESVPTEDRKGAGTGFNMYQTVVENESLKGFQVHNPSATDHTAPRSECPSTSSNTTNQKPEISLTSETTANQEIPSTSSTTAYHELPSTSRTTAYHELPSTSRTTAYHELSSTSRTTAYHELPSTSRTTAYNELSSTSRTTAYQELPSTSGTTAYHELPSTSGTIAYQEIQSKSSTNGGTIEIPASPEGVEIGFPYPSQHNNPFDMKSLPSPLLQKHLQKYFDEFFLTNDYPRTPSPDSLDLSDDDSDLLEYLSDLSSEDSSMYSTSLEGEDDLSEITTGDVSGIVPAKPVGENHVNLNKDLASSSFASTSYQSHLSVIVKPSTSDSKHPIVKTSQDGVEPHGKVDDFPNQVGKNAISDHRTTGQLDEVLRERPKMADSDETDVAETLDEVEFNRRKSLSRRKTF